MQPAGTQREEFGQKRSVVHNKILPKKLPHAYKEAGPAQTQLMAEGSVGSHSNTSGRRRRGRRNMEDAHMKGGVEKYRGNRVEVLHVTGRCTLWPL